MRPGIVAGAVMVCLALPAAGGFAASDGVYSGTTSQGRAISITVSGGYVTAYSINWVCGPGSSELDQTISPGCLITGGSFSCGTASCIPFTAQVHIEGTFSGSSVTGSFDLKFQPNPTSGCCSLNDITYTASTAAAPPEIAIGDVQVAEGDAGTVTAEFQVTLTPAADDTVTVDWTTGDGTADSLDYASGSGTLSFMAGQTTKTVEVAVYGDTEEEADEVFYVDLSGATNAEIADSRGQATILDDDGAGPVTLYDQLDNEGDSGLPAQNDDPANDAWDSEGADDFTVDGGGWSISRVQVIGFYSENGGPADSINIRFYPDSNGSPAENPSCSYTELVPISDQAGSLTAGPVVIDLPRPCTLAPGTYWLATQVNMSWAEGGDYYWALRTVQSGSGAVWRNPGDAWGTGATTWTPLPEIHEGIDPDFLYQLSGSLGSDLTIFEDGFETGSCASWSLVVGEAP